MCGFDVSVVEQEEKKTQGRNGTSPSVVAVCIAIAQNQLGFSLWVVEAVAKWLLAGHLHIVISWSHAGAQEWLVPLWSSQAGR